jgi:uncharacterized protein with FMN-binding domain
VTGTFTRDAVQTRYGVVQVEITVVDGAITSADAVRYPDWDRESAQINAWAVPVLDEEVVSAQSADIDLVCGATVTSAAYVSSPQSALDEAGQ